MGRSAVLTQNRTDPRLGPLILGDLRAGVTPEEIIKDLELRDPNLRWRQLAVLATDGRGAFFNGNQITSTHKGRVGRDCVAVGNIIRRTEVVDAMVESFEANEKEPLAERLLRAIEAGHTAGSEWKQIKSAALVVAHKESFPYVDLRVDMSPTPLSELRFLWELYLPSIDDYVVRAIDPDSATPPA